MILYEWSGDELEEKEFFIPNDNLYVIFTTDQTNNASGFLLHYEVIEKRRKSTGNLFGRDVFVCFF